MLADLLRAALNVLLPRTCAACGADLPPSSGYAACGACWEAVPRWLGRACVVCDQPLPDGGARCRGCRGRRRAFRFLRSAGLYEGPLRALVVQLKYRGREDAARPLARLMRDRWSAEARLGPVDAVVPVPLHWTRERLRGFNQSEILARAFAGKLGLPVRDALRRGRATRTQTDLDRSARAGNVRGAFAVRRPEAVRGKSLLLIDDVCTTGATVEACALALKAAGARAVGVLTAARQPSF